MGASIAASHRVSARNDSHVTLEYPAGSAWAGIGKPDRPRRGHVAIAPDLCIDHGKPVIGFAADVDVLSVVELVYAWMGEPRATFDGEKAVSVRVETDNHPVAATSVKTGIAADYDGHPWAYRRVLRSRGVGKCDADQYEQDEPNHRSENATTRLPSPI